MRQAVGDINACGPVSDFRGDGIPKNGPGSGLIRQGLGTSGSVRIPASLSFDDVGGGGGAVGQGDLDSRESRIKRQQLKRVWN